MGSWVREIVRSNITRITVFSTPNSIRSSVLLLLYRVPPYGVCIKKWITEEDWNSSEVYGLTVTDRLFTGYVATKLLRTHNKRPDVNVQLKSFGI